MLRRILLVLLFMSPWVIAYLLYNLTPEQYKRLNGRECLEWKDEEHFNQLALSGLYVRDVRSVCIRYKD